MCRNWHVCVGRGASVSAAGLLCRPPRGCVGRRRLSPNLSCNVTTSSKCATCDELQEKIRSIASRPAQKVTGKSSEQSIKSVLQAACACVGQKFPTPSPPPRPPHPPSPSPPLEPKNNHTVNRRQCCETFQASCNVPSILQRANFLATSQQLLNVPS